MLWNDDDDEENYFSLVFHLTIPFTASFHHPNPQPSPAPTSNTYKKAHLGSWPDEKRNEKDAQV